MAAATSVTNNNNSTPSPHSSNASSPQSQATRLSPPSNTPVYTQEDVVRFVQAALAAACRDQTLHSHARPQHSQLLQEERIMKPRVHMYESFGAQHSMITTLELPGLQKNDVSITARPNGDLVVSGERRPQHLLLLQNLQGAENGDQEISEDERGEKGRTVFNELKFGRFQRVIRLPNGTDPSTITASMDDGMLTICWPLPSNPSASEQRVKRETASDDVHMDDLEAKRATLRSS